MYDDIIWTETNRVVVYDKHDTPWTTVEMVASNFVSGMGCLLKENA